MDGRCSGLHRVVREEIGIREVSFCGDGVDYRGERGAGWGIGVFPLHTGGRRVVGVDVEAAFTSDYSPAGGKRTAVMPRVFSFHSWKVSLRVSRGD